MTMAQGIGVNKNIQEGSRMMSQVLNNRIEHLMQGFVYSLVPVMPSVMPTISIYRGCNLE